MATIFEDNFNAYNDGNLPPQGSWVAWSGNCQVQGVTVKEGAKAVRVQSAVLNYKEGSTINDGRLVVYLNSGDNSNDFVIHLREGSGQGAATRIHFLGLNLTGTRTVDYYQGGVGWVNLGTFTADEWFSVEAEWRSSDHKVRWRFNEGAWTDWIAPYAAWTNGVNQVLFECGLNAATYVDYIAENPYVPPAAGRSYGFIFAKIYENLRNLAQRIFRFPALVNPGNLPAI